MTHMYRTCSKCGATQASNPELRMHRFPALAQNNENFFQLLSWAMFFDPEKDWFDVQALGGLYQSGKVLCSRHFDESAYTSQAKIRLQKFAMPSMDENKENQDAPTAGPSHEYKPNVLVDHGQIIPEEREMPISSVSKSDNDQIIQLDQGKSAKMKCKATVSKMGPSVQSKKRQNLTSSERKIYNKYKYLLRKVRQLKTKLKQRKSVDVLQMLCGNEDVIKLLKLKISPSMALLLQGELQNGQRKHRGRRWNQNQKFLALELYKKSPRTYKVLSRLFCLPGPSTLRRLLGQFILKPEINEMIFENIKNCANKNTDTDNLCIITFDEMSIMKNVNYNPKSDQIEGYQDHGRQGKSKVFSSTKITFDEMSIMKNVNYNPKSDQIEGYQDHGRQGKSKVFSSHALVFMLVWIRQMKKQPVAYYLSGDYVTADRLTVLIKEVLHECLNAGINVCATVCDMDGVNVKALENLGSSVDHPYFEFEGHEVVTLPDPPHLLKCFRNLFMNYDVKLPIPVQSGTTTTTQVDQQSGTTTTTQIDQQSGTTTTTQVDQQSGTTTTTQATGVASWKHIEQFYEMDNSNPHFVFAPKLSKNHIQPNGKEKMRVKLATQIFSHSVAMGIYSKACTNELPAGAIATATFLEHFNNLFDLLNANSPDKEQGKPFKTNWTSKSPHKDFIQKSKQILNEMEFIGCKRKPPSQTGWLKLLNGYERLWDNLNKNNIKSLATRRINQDPLENCFGCIRANCGSNDNPTASQFVAGLKTAIVTNLRNVVKSNRNCEDDNGELLENFKYLFSKNKSKIELDNSEPDPDPNVSGYEISICDEEIETSAETQACAYVCGFIFKKYAKNCVHCKKAMLAEKPTEIHQFTEFKEYVDGKHSLQYANHRFIACVEKCAEVINQYLKHNPHLENIKANCIKLIRKDVDFNFLKACPEHLSANINMIEQSSSIILIKRFCVLENRRFASEYAKKRLAKKIKILKNS